MTVYVVLSISQGEGETLQKIFKNKADADQYAFDFGSSHDWVDSVDVIDYEVE